MVLDVSTGICLGLACSSCEASKSPGHSLETTQDFTKASEASWSYSCDSKVSFDRVQILPPDILRPHSLTLTLTLSLSHCLSHLSHLSHLFLISLISLSSLSLSPLCLSSFRLSSLSSLAGGSGQRATYKGLFTPASKKSAVFFPTSLPSTFPFWSASFRPPLASSLA